MWKNSNDEMLCLVYYAQDNYIILKIFSNKNKKDISYDYLSKCNYYALIKDPYKLKHYKISDNNLDVLKTKCLIKAKEVGWNISKIII